MGNSSSVGELEIFKRTFWIPRVQRDSRDPCAGVLNDLLSLLPWTHVEIYIQHPGHPFSGEISLPAFDTFFFLPGCFLDAPPPNPILFLF